MLGFDLNVMLPRIEDQVSSFQQLGGALSHHHGSNWYQSRLAALESKLQAEQLIEDKIKEQERKRSESDPHMRKSPVKLKQSLQRYTEKAKERLREKRALGQEHSRPDPKWASADKGGGAFPDLNVIGFPKSGSTHMFMVSSRVGIC